MSGRFREGNSLEGQVGHAVVLPRLPENLPLRHLHQGAIRAGRRPREAQERRCHAQAQSAVHCRRKESSFDDFKTKENYIFLTMPKLCFAILIIIIIDIIIVFVIITVISNAIINIFITIFITIYTLLLSSLL